MAIRVDTRNGQALARHHQAMVQMAQRAYTMDNQSQVLSERSRMANDAGDGCLDAPDMLPSGGARQWDDGYYGYRQRLVHRAA